ncbi:MAG: non-hydrolyzing UDP-N-acetylglucosamine 2-epimerase [Gemmatimonadales bacterium]
MNVLTVVGARPQFIKAALVSEAMRARGDLIEVLVHTGQHYDPNMSDVFFSQLGLAAPQHNLGVGSGRHGWQTGEMMARLEPIVATEEPDWLLIYGDTNSTLAGALVAAKLCVPVAHVEAGLRSFNRRMPEEVNRIVADTLATALFAPTGTAVQNLAREGITRGVRHVGDVMLDLLQRARPRAEAGGTLPALRLTRDGYYLATIHRAENTDDLNRLTRLLGSLDRLPAPVVFPVHPRTRGALQATGWRPRPGTDLRLIDPVGYLEMVELEAHARAILTDSGGVQKEAFFLGRPCITLRDETEWTETLEGGWNVLVGTDADRIVSALERSPTGPRRLDAFGNGTAAGQIAAVLAQGASCVS